MRQSAACGYLCSSEGLAATLRDLRRLAGVFTHPQHPVNLSPFLYQQSFGMHVAMNDTRRLQLDALLGIDRSAHFAADDGLAAHHIAVYFPAPRDQHLLRRTDRPVHRALDLHDAVRRDVADDTHPRADDRLPGHASTAAAGRGAL